MISLAHRKREFDYLVVGGGAAGCAVAARLADDPKLAVALIEAGGRPHPILSIPLLGVWAWRRWPRRFCWIDRSVPQAAVDRRRIELPAGRMLGGSTAINAMIHSRGDRASYDRWRSVTADGWDWSSLWPCFLRTEDYRAGSSSARRGRGGPIAVAGNRFDSPLTEAFLEACEQSGLERRADFNQGDPTGAGIFEVTQERGRRAPASRYLTRTRGGRRVETMLDSRATRLLLDGDRAVGVELRFRDQRRELFARREVVLAAGAVRTPQILLASGIGPPDELLRAGVEPKVASPEVGKNLQDHVRVPVRFRYRGRREDTALGLLRHAATYAWQRRGLLASAVCDAGAVLRSAPSKASPDLRIIFQWHARTAAAEPCIGFDVALIDPRSRGEITLRSADPLVPPEVDPRYLSAIEDFEALTEGIRRARRIASQPSLRAAGLGEEIEPGDDELAAHVRRHLESGYHLVGTCRLGDDQDSVVDSRLRVRGVAGLRIVDASVMPTTVSGHAQAAVLAIAERAAELMLSPPDGERDVRCAAGSAAEQGD